MKKLIYPDQNEELAKAVDGCFAKIILNNKMVKEASSNYLTREMLDECKPDKDHFLIHFIGVGDYERYGFNKNADAFTKEANEKYHKTFEKHAHLFREHNSSNPEVNAIGIIKKAMYNPEMGRTELAVWANIKKASEEYEKAKAGETLSCSMGASLAYDVDSITGKHSKNPSEYEPHMKKHAGQFIPEFNKYAFVYNPEPKFFDLSIVKRPAERIAHYLEYQFPELDKQAFVKAASEYNACIPSAILAEIEGLHYHLDSGFSDPDKAKLLNKLASYEKEFKDALVSKSEDLKTKYIKYAAINSFSEEASELNDVELNNLVNLNVRPESIFREFAKRAAVMPFKTFCKYIYGDKLNEEAVKYASIHILPNVFEDLTKTDLDISELENLFDKGSVFDCACDNADSDPVQKLMNKAEEKFSVDDENLGKRIINITIIGSPSEETLANIIPNILSKQAGEVSDKLKQKAKEYASIYGVYKVAAINDILELNKSKIANEEQMLLSLIGQNYIYHH